MARCATCGQPVECSNCGPPREIDEPVLPCPHKTKGGIWVRVDDDAQAHIQGAPVSLAGRQKLTDPLGIASFDELEAGDYTVTLDPLGNGLAKAFDLPETTERKPKVATKIVLVTFKLTRRAKLEVHVVKKGDHKVKMSGAAIKIVEGDEAPKEKDTAEGVADFGLTKPGNYSIQVQLKSEDAMNFLAPAAPVKVHLAAGHGKPIIVEVLPLARPEIRLVWGENQKAEGIGVKLRKDDKVYDFGKTNAEGIASLAADATGMLPDDYELLLEFDDKVYARRKSH